MKKKLIFIFFLVLFLLRPLLILYEQRETFLSRGYEEHYEEYKSQYYSSQYVKKHNPGIIPDSTLEIFAAGAFLKGLNPILIVHDQPPLGRYLIALSLLLFDNPSTITLFVLLFSAIGVYLLGKIVLDDPFFALVPVGIFINEPLFTSKFIYTPLLEPIQLPFILFSIYLFIKGIQDKDYFRWFLLSSFMIGCVISIRFFVLGAGIIVAFFLYFLLRRKLDRKLIFFVLSLPVSLLVLIASYFRTMQNGYSVWQIFGVQKYIWTYHKSALVLPFTFWDLLLFNRWHTWWGERAISHDIHWIFFWPVAMILTIISTTRVLLKRIKLPEAEKVILLWIFVYCALLSVGYTSTRYFLPLIPFLYIIATAFSIRLITYYKKQKK